MARWLLAWVLVLGACGAETSGGEGEAPVEEPDDDLPDADQDGLCDFTERELGTDPESVDGDGDGLPDVVELITGFGPVDPSAPAPDQIGYLEARSGGATDFTVRATVDGEGQGVTGYFEALPSPYPEAFNAADFFMGSTAVSATPSDGVRHIDADSARFGDVHGSTRLTFSLRFEYPWNDLGALECARSYPFRHLIKTDDGETRADRRYLLIVAPEGTAGASVDHCLPRSCQ